MMHTTNVLFDEIIRAAHCPDPRCAARVRPFSPSPQRVIPAEMTAMRPAETAGCCPDVATVPGSCC